MLGWAPGTLRYACVDELLHGLLAGRGCDGVIAVAVAAAVPYPVCHIVFAWTRLESVRERRKINYSIALLTARGWMTGLPAPTPLRTVSFYIPNSLALEHELFVLDVQSRSIL